MIRNLNTAQILSSVLALGIFAGATWNQALAQTPSAKKQTPPTTITRANLAKNAAFTVTSTLAPKGGDKLVTTYKVEVKGNKARLDYDDPAIGQVMYLANEKGVFFVIPSNNTAMKQTFKGGVEGALKVAFSQFSSQLAGAKKVGTATVSGLPTAIYKDADSGATIYMGTVSGFRLPVKAVLENEGGTRTFMVSNINLKPVLKDDRFALPKGTQIIEQGEGGGTGGLPIAQ